MLMLIYGRYLSLKGHTADTKLEHDLSAYVPESSVDPLRKEELHPDHPTTLQYTLHPTR